ncbi:nucleic acid dioxygenase ALKBH1 [Euwallacea fornicatus]|uniref:nucleic acid dioxygenase ALKBH1 n=1 Tax=Euwallacea fornicatus TaxID=995702 RepID=UPI00338D8BC1
MFKDSFKYYKSKNPPPELGRVLDFDCIHKFKNKVQQVPLPSTNLSPFFGLKPLDTWEVYEITDRPGLIFIRNPFTPLGQRFWPVRCLKDYSRKPNKSNLDGFNLVPDNKDWWELCQSSNKLLLNKLRWVTLGYHHNWDTKVYSESNRSKFPKDLKELTAFLAKALGYDNFSAEAAIVNYYHMDSTLSGHKDRSERNLTAPLFSLSFGQTAIFLIGGESIEDIAIPIFLRSGDVVVMSKDSRLCYHGVPKILQVDSRRWSLVENSSEKLVVKEHKEVMDICKNDALWQPFGDYLTHSRINVNVRQVLYDGEVQLD